MCPEDDPKKLDVRRWLSHSAPVQNAHYKAVSPTDFNTDIRTHIDCTNGQAHDESDCRA